jgi:hypothetical protein
VFALRCTASGDIWVSASADLDASRNGVFFMLRNGMHHNKALQAAWNAHGAEAFQWEIVETFDEDLPRMSLKDTMRDRQKFWESELSAAMV